MINVNKTYLPNLKKYEEYLNKIFKSGIVTNNGEMVRTLEKELKEYLGVRNIILLSNGTMALQVAYKLLNLSNEVLTTPFSFVATVSSQFWQGLTSSFVDIDENTFNMNPDLIEKNISKNTSAIVPVHVFGNSCAVERIDQIGKKNNLKVIYDAAHAFAVKYKDKSILNYGDISTLSFHATKIFHTIEGGALVIKDDDVYEKAKLMINFGINGPDSIVELGINAKMNEFEAAMGLCILEDMPTIIKKRKEVYEYYKNNLCHHVAFQKITKDTSQNYIYFPILFEHEEILINVKNELINENIYPRRYFYPCLSNLPYIKKKSNVPIADSISKRILCLPLYDTLSLEEVSKIISIINRCLEVKE